MCVVCIRQFVIFWAVVIGLAVAVYFLARWLNKNRRRVGRPVDVNRIFAGW